MPVYAANTLDITYVATLDNSTIQKSDSDQTVTLTINASSSIALAGIEGVVTVGDHLKVEKIELADGKKVLEKDDLVDYFNANTGNLAFERGTAYTEITEMIKVTYTVPANTAAGTYTVGITDMKIAADGDSVWENGANVSTTLTITDSSSGDSGETNTEYQVYYQITGTDSDTDSFVEINPGATFDVGVYVKTTDGTTKKMQAFDIYPTWVSMLSYVSVTDVTGKGIVADEMSKTTPHFYSVAKDLNMDVDGNGVQIATMTLKLSEDAVYNTGYAVSLSSKTNLAVELNAESVPVTVDATARGAETLKKVKVTFNTNGGSTVAEQKIGYNTSANKPENTSKDGYTFDNWYKEAAFTNIFDFATQVKADTTIYAKWTANGVTVNLNANGGKFADDSTTKEVSETFDSKYSKVFETAAPTREGYGFAGWYDAATEGTQITANSTVTNHEEHTLYAQWTANTYTIAFNLNGVTGTTPASIIATYNTEYTLPTMNIEGYTFGGWKLGETIYTGGQKVSNLTAEDNATVTLVAQWTQNTYQIEASAPNGTISALNNKDNTASANKDDVINVTVKPNAGYNIASVTYTPKGGQVQTITVTKQDDGSYTGTFKMPAANVTVSATFTATDYTVTVDSSIQNGTVKVKDATEDTEYHVGDTITLNVTPATGYKVKDNAVTYTYTKDGDTQATVETATEQEDGTYTFAMPAAAVTVTAEFEGQTYKVTLNANEGGFVDGDETSNTKEIDVTYDSAYGTLPEPTRVGYAFVGWYDAASGGNKIESTTVVATADAHTLYAHWTANEYTITFVTNGGTFADNSGVVENEGKYTMTYTYGDTNAKLPEITKALHELTNWTVSYATDATEKGWGDESATITVGSSISDKFGDVTLTANWEAAFTYEVEDYKYAPNGYVMLRIATTGNTNSYVFGSGESAIAMYYTEDTNYKVGNSFAFVTLIPTEGNVEFNSTTGKYQLTPDGSSLISQTGAAAVVIARDGKVNNDDVVNIADANAVYQMVIGTGNYYSLTQLDILNRLEADMDTAIVTEGDNKSEYRSSILDVHKIVDIINKNANTTNP